jgi:hypothetical protein
VRGSGVVTSPHFIGIFSGISASIDATRRIHLTIRAIDLRSNGNQWLNWLSHLSGQAHQEV